MLEKFAAVQMIDVHLPTTDGRELKVETPQIISRAAHALPDGKCFSLANPPGLLYEPVPGPMLCSQRRCQRSSSSPRARVRARTR